ncbi:MAG: rhodanese-like domain-containing protein, partial [Saprospiraceae bacterium]|nr:rhodanese-like domain-containing protein [Saprospiraceae bacterium]
EVKSRGMSSLTPEVFEVVAEESGAVLLDTRPATDFYKGYVPQSINIGLKGDFAPWVGSLIADVNQPILLITSPGEEEESVTRLSRVGFDNVLGHLEGGVDEWIKSGKEIDTVDRITVDAFKGALESGGHQILDVRKESEYEGGHVANAENKPLANINDWIRDINPAKHYLIHCAGGYRSMVAASILQARGYRNFSEIEGGYAAISQTEIPTTVVVAEKI